MTAGPDTTRTPVDGAATARFEFLIEHLPRVAAAIAAFGEDLRTSAFWALLNTVNVAEPGDSAAVVAVLDARLRLAETIQERNAAELGKLGAFLTTRYPGAFPATGSVVDSAIHLLKEGWGPGRAGDAQQVKRLGAWLGENAPSEYSLCRTDADTVDAAIRLLGEHLSCPAPPVMKVDIQPVPYTPTDLRSLRQGGKGTAKA